MRGYKYDKKGPAREIDIGWGNIVFSGGCFMGGDCEPEVIVPRDLYELPASSLKR